MSEIYEIWYDESENCNPSFAYAISKKNAERFAEYKRDVLKARDVHINTISTIDDNIDEVME